MIDKLFLPKAYVEVLEILKYIPLEDYKKIPNEIIENMKVNSDKQYIYKITNFNNFEEQEMLKETEAILAVLYRDYWATEEERKIILFKESADLKILEEEKAKKYDPQNIFQKNTDFENNDTKNTNIIVYKESFFSKLKEFILKILHIK